MKIPKYLSNVELMPLDIDITFDKIDLIVVIPCFDENEVVDSVKSISNCELNEQNIVVIVVINHRIDASDQAKSRNLRACEDLIKYRSELQTEQVQLGIIKAFDLTDKKAGVGLARKMGMDVAAMLYTERDMDGVIACYDADSSCLPNYCISVIKAFKDKSIDGISIHFEHPLDSDRYSDEVIKAITQYEAHLRYFLQVQIDIDLSFAIHTVGSSMAVRSSSYCKFGGMNRRQAGEDFYFLQKFIENGKVIPWSETMVIPSPRLSHRVPFGTGKAVQDMLSTDQEPIFETYDPRSFQELSPFVDLVPEIYQSSSFDGFVNLHAGVVEYFESIGMLGKIEESKKNTASYDQFYQRIFRHFNAFQLMKYAHYMRDNYFPNIPVEEAIKLYFKNEKISTTEGLLRLREMQK